MKKFGSLSFLLCVCVCLIRSEVIEILDSFGEFSSPDYPDPYRNNENITWTIPVRTGYRIRLYFTVFDIEDSFEVDIGNCAYDYVKVNQGRWCGNKYTGTGNAYKSLVFYSQENPMTVQFVSDYSNEAAPIGFVAHHSEEDVNECKEIRVRINSGLEDWEDMLYCDHQCHNTKGSYYCSCRLGFSLHSNKHTCVADCHRDVILKREGTVTSPDYPNMYSKLANCETKIDVGVGRTIEIRFDPRFDIERHYELGCVYDWIKVKCGKLGIMETYCGSTAPSNGSWVSYNSNFLSVTFHSDLSQENLGFKMYYRSIGVRCQEILLPSENGKIISAKQDYYEADDIITFGCHPGYRLDSENADVTCLVNGNWDRPVPICEILSCPYPSDIINRHKIKFTTSIFQLSLTYQSEIHLGCQIWYGKSAGVFDWNCTEDATWKPMSEPVVGNTTLPECSPECGVKNQVGNRNILGFILGGRASRIGEWPWMAFIDLQPARPNAFCGGSLVAEQFVISAAHCFNRYQWEFMRVDLGVTDRNNLTYQQSFRIVELDIHSNYSRENEFGIYDSDIAILKLDRKVRPICIPRSTREKELPERGLRGSHLYQGYGAVIGWGKDEQGKLQDISRTVRVPAIQLPDCREHFAAQTVGDIVFRNTHVSDNMICAGFLNRVKDSCQGDSGGPLTWRDLSSNRWMLNGIVSFGTTGSQGCNILQGLGIYTRVGNYVEFIDGIID